jgi:hypothetical protein
MAACPPRLKPRAQLARVLQSAGLKSSDGLRNLLAYLGEKALTAPSEELKEYTVGVEACGKPESYNPQDDSSVRVQAGRLRKRIEEYYGSEGAADPILIEVPKGRFAVVFHARAVVEAPGANRRWMSVGLGVAREFAPIWGGFLTGANPTLAVFGSPEGAAGQGHECAAMGDTLAVQRLTSFFATAGVALRAQPAHLANWDSASEGNLVLLGAWQMNPLMRGLPVQQDFAFGPDGLVFNRNPQPGEPLAYTAKAGAALAIVASYAGLKPGRAILAIVTEHPGAPVGAVDFLTDRRSGAVLMEKLATNPGRGHFQMLLRVYVDGGAAVKTEYVTHHVD